MKTGKVIEHKDGSVSMEFTFTRKETEKIMSYALNKMIEEGLNIREEVECSQ